MLFFSVINSVSLTEQGGYTWKTKIVKGSAPAAAGATEGRETALQPLDAGICKKKIESHKRAGSTLRVRSQSVSQFSSAEQ